MIVAKFGGSSNRDAKATLNCILRIKENPNIRVVVVSATEGTTRELERLANEALAGTDRNSLEADLDTLIKRHLVHAEHLKIDASEQLQVIQRRLSELFQGVGALQELSPRTLDHILSQGEQMNACIFQKACAKHLDMVHVSALDIMLTDSTYGQATPQMSEIHYALREHLLPHLEQNKIVITEGYIGKDRQGRNTTLGKEGSDFSAAILASLLSASELQIWTDVSGIHSSDPRIIDDTRPIPQLSYEQSELLAQMGARVLHPKTIAPIKSKRIPLRVLNTFAPDDSSTLISEAPGESDILGVSWIDGLHCYQLSCSDPIELMNKLRSYSNIFLNIQIKQNIVELISKTELHPDALKGVEVKFYQAGVSLVGVVGNKLDAVVKARPWCSISPDLYRFLTTSALDNVKEIHSYITR